MKKILKDKKAITLIALVITIVVLVILAVVTISLTVGNDGLISRAIKAAKGYKDAQEKDKQSINDLYGQLTIAADGTIQGLTTEQLKDIVSEQIATETQELKNKVDAQETKIAALESQELTMKAPLLLTKASLASTSSSSREAGTYKASSASYTKSNQSRLSNYLTFTQNTGWTVQKSGWYLVRALARQEYTPDKGSGYMRCYWVINGSDVAISHAEIAQGTYYTAEDESSDTLWLNEGDVIDYKYYISVDSRWSYADFYIYALFQ